jgi:WXG100 family type VII secretion target
MSDVSVSMNSFEGVRDSAKGFMQAADRMEQRLEQLMRKVNAMGWSSDGRQAFDQIQARFNTAYLDLKKILWELGSNVDGIAVRQGDLEQFLKQRVWVQNR